MSTASTADWIREIGFKDSPGSLDLKRCYLPLTVTAKCSTCGVLVTKDLETAYLSYPKLNVPFEMPMHHTSEDEEHDWTVGVILRVTLEAAP
jgi:hypothetical protein